MLNTKEAMVGSPLRLGDDEAMRTIRARVVGGADSFVARVEKHDPTFAGLADRYDHNPCSAKRFVLTVLPQRLRLRQPRRRK